MKINTEKIILYTVLIAVGAGISILVFGKSNNGDNALLNKVDSQYLTLEKKQSTFKKYQELAGIEDYVNTDNKPITIGEFIGKKVILLDFVTYSCINCQRTFPYLKNWYEKYHDQGLEIIAIHTPEFAFEHEKTNVEKAFKEFGLKFPAVLDNKYATWNVYGNSYWPRKYLIDIDGFIVYDHIGEGEYDETESKIVDLLNEKNTRFNLPKIEGGTIGRNIFENNLGSGLISPETYLGSDRADKQYGQKYMCTNGSCTYSESIDIPENRFSLSGRWQQLAEYIQLMDTKGSLFYHFTAGKVHLVADADSPVTAEIFIDGAPIKSEIAGSDVIDGKVTFSEPRLYTLVDSKGALETHLLEIKINQKGFRGYAFTFGK